MLSPDSPKTVADGKVVSIHYTLTNDAGEVLDTSTGETPVDYLHGAGNIVPGLEERLTGQTVGAHLEIEVPPEEGYGVHDPAGVQSVPVSSFPGNVDLQPGMEFQAEAPEGDPLPFRIVSVDGDLVTIDFNHPLAGETLHFDVTVTSVRDASKNEVEHGHPHGPGDEHHGHDHSR